ncbi:LysR family transcriptional regulator [Paracidovorax cattleyae]|uniref:LysR family transcriptional regulator n=1 Tax=Paracidovorax cattleyae TaxID=80868 RepID=UPI0018AFAA8A|nr:LysR family transcriptional regulator [Paracidovorax cattleyae]MBF9263677.1 LysR family transcriptional regulator [Paracidovorax cattleyae]
MNIESVRLLLEVADSGSINKVAARRQTAQSHISRQVSEFEKQLGAALFVRTGRGVVPTDAGRNALPRLRRWLHETEALSESLRTEAGTLSGEVRLGIIPSAAHHLMPCVFQRLRQEHPGIRLNVVEAQGTELNAMLDSGSVDMAIVFRFQPPRGSEEKVLAVAHTFLVSAPGDPLTALPGIDFRRLQGLPLVLPRRPSQWRTALDETARSQGFRLDAVVEADSLTLQKELVTSTKGLYTVLGPYSIAQERASGRLQASRLLEPDLSRLVTLAFPRQGKSSPASRCVADMIKDWSCPHTPCHHPFDGGDAFTDPPDSTTGRSAPAPAAREAVHGVFVQFRPSADR